jgi:predicted ATPase/DNA-binding winged helix-turn-helix (wHTH) protein
MSSHRLRICTLHLDRMQVVREDGTELTLSPKEMRLLRVLLEVPGGVVDRDRLNREVLGQHESVISRALDAMVYRLRAKIEADPTHPEHLLTVHSEGYKLELAPSEACGSVLAAVGLAQPAELDWDLVLAEELHRSGGTERAREGDERLISFSSPSRAVTFALACTERVPSARAAVIHEASHERSRRVLAAASANSVLLTEEIYDSVSSATGIRDAPWRALGAVRLLKHGPVERLVVTGGDGSSLLRAEGNLVPPLGPLLGRQSELARAEGLLREGRLVTLTGTGGVGKTRLAQELGRQWQDRGAGAWFCELSDCRTEAEVLEGVAQALGLSDSSGTLSFLGHDLLILDNAEQAVPAVRAVVQRWAAQSGGARLLVTSRERLGASSEHVLELSLLPAQDAVALFVQRARELGVWLQASEEIRTLVGRLDGLPLAIELAAARTEVLSPEILLERLDERLDILGGESARGRHADLHTMVAWSWELCEPAEREVLVACVPFVAPFALSDVEAVAGSDTLDVLHALRRRGLLRSPAPGKLAHYASVRAFVLATAEPAALTAARDRHARWLARWGEASVDERLHTRREPALLQELVASLPDLLAAFEHALPREPELAVRVFLGAGLAMYRAGPNDRIEALAQRVLPLGLERLRIQRLRTVHGASPEILREVDEALRQEPEPRNVLLRIWIGWWLGERTRCVQLLEELLPVLRTSGDEMSLSRALGWAAQLLPEEERAALLRERLALCRRRGDRDGECDVHKCLGWMALGRGARDVALEEAARAVALSKDLPAGWAQLESLVLLGEVHRLRGEFGPALAALEEGLELSRRMGAISARAGLLNNLALLHAVFTDTSVARQLYEEALSLPSMAQASQQLLGNLGALDEAEDRLDEAIDKLDQAIEGHRRHALPWAALLYVFRGRARGRRGELPKALSDLDEALVREPLGPLAGTALLQRAVVQARMGDRAGAEADLQRATEALERLCGPGTERAELALCRAEVAVSLGLTAEVPAVLREARRELDVLGVAPASVYARLWARLFSQQTMTG